MSKDQYNKIINNAKNTLDINIVDSKFMWDKYDVSVKSSNDIFV